MNVNLKKIWLVLLCFCLSGMSSSLLAGEGKNILFIGNSFTFGGPIAQLVQSLAISAGWPAPQVETVAVGGQSLGFHRTNADTLAAIDKGNWDFVVLQEYSTKATDNIGNPAEFKADATFLYDYIKTSSPNAKIVMYETWARHEDNSMYPDSFTDRDQMQSQINAHYHDCVENYIPNNSNSEVKTDILLAPAGQAWHSNYHDQNLLLHDTDLYHARSQGQYLSAMAIYSIIYDRMVIGLTTLLSITADQAEYLQGICDSVTGKTIPMVGSGANPIKAGDKIYIDFGANKITPGNWNTISNADGSIANCITDSGDAIVVSVTIPDRFSDQNSNGSTTPDSQLNLPMEATSDSFYGNDVSFSGYLEPTAQIAVSNLNPDLLYRLTFFASRMGVSDNRQTQYNINGLETDAETLYLNPSNNNNTAVTSDFIPASSTGIITIDVQKGPANNNGSGFYYLGLMKIEATQGPGCSDVLIILNNGQVINTVSSADINGIDGIPDCQVNILDFAKMVVQWLQCSNPDQSKCITNI